MKYNKRICFLSIFATIISLVLYFSFRTCCDIVKDLSLSLFSASCLLTFTSYVGYCVEKSALKRKILSTEYEVFYISLVKESSSNEFDLYSIKRATQNAYQNLHILHEYLLDFYNGCFKKDETLKTLINDKVRHYAEELTRLEVYTASKNPKSEVLKKKIELLNTTSEDVINSLLDWIEDTKFETGDEFQFSENFIADYEDDDA